MQRPNMKTLLPAGLVVENVRTGGGAIEIGAHSASASVLCPGCGDRSEHVHSHYYRRLADLPAHVLEVRIMLAVRRFRCRSA